MREREKERRVFHWHALSADLRGSGRWGDGWEVGEAGGRGKGLRNRYEPQGIAPPDWRIPVARHQSGGRVGFSNRNRASVA